MWGLILSLGLIGTVLTDAFESVILPRRATGKYRPTRLTYRLTWPLWSYVPRRLGLSRGSANYLSWYGPLSMFMLLTLWACGLILGFALLHWSLGSAVHAAGQEGAFLLDLYLSGTTFFTLGLGDVVPQNGVARAVTVIEAGLGFGFLALVIGYLPVLYSAFSNREIQISMLDSRAGSPPSATEILARLGRRDALHHLDSFLGNWETAGAQTLETHISYPILMYYRSHQNNQSWLAAATAVLDTCALVLSGIDNVPDTWQAQQTFAMLRLCIVELGVLLGQKPQTPSPGRLSEDERVDMYDYLAHSGVHCAETPERRERLSRLRTMYEPYVSGLSEYLLLPLPPWNPGGPVRENWKTTTFEHHVNDI